LTDLLAADMTDLQRARNHFEAQFRRVQASIEKEVGIARRWNWGWAVTITALAAGVALGYTLRSNRRLKTRKSKRLT
jgi:hypothetical protein